MVLNADRRTIAADGRDVAVVNIEIQDSKGRFVPDACPVLTFRLEGDGRILGCGNGDPAYLGEDHPKQKDCREFSIPAFNGRAQVLIQSGHTAGDIALTCTSEALAEASISITAAPR